ncbi:MAG: DUF1570 domain-containing protein [Candidatus Eisenbacteria bacterium]
MDFKSLAIVVLSCFAGAQASAGGEMPAAFEVHSQPGMISTDHFQILHAPHETDSWVELGAVLEDSYACFQRVFSDMGFRPSGAPEPLVWQCFRSRPAYERYCQWTECSLSWLDSQYSTRTNCVVLFQERDRAGEGGDLRQITHEAAHQLAFNCGLMRRGVFYPFWVAEGIATNFERDDEQSDLRLSPNAERCVGLARRAQDGEMTPLAELVTASSITPELSPMAGALYDESWGFFRFLLLHHPAALRRYLTELRERPPAVGDEEALQSGFCRIFGDLEPLESAWRLFALHLTDGPLPPRSDLPR